MPKVSIIIPVYNAENKLDRTMESVMGQTLRDFEVILIDDGSKDGSVSVARAWEEKDPRIHLFVNAQNRGVSATRNAGLDHATGEYVRFVDGDDIIPAESTEEMVKTAEKNAADLVIGIMRRQSAAKSYVFAATARVAAKKKISKYDEDLIHSFSVCNKMFRRSVIEQHQLRFQPYAHAEDGMFLYQFLQYAGHITGCNQEVYTYNKPEFFEEPTTTANLTKEMLVGILDVSEKIRSIDPDAPQEFIDKFNARILGVTLINEYYRKIWRTEPDALALLLEKIEAYWNILPDKQRNEVVRMNKDLPVSQGLGGKEEILEHARFTIVVGKGVSKAHLPILLESLYYQKSPFFEVLLHPCFEQDLPALYKEAENIRVITDTENFYDAQVAACTGDYIMFIEHDITFTVDALTVAYDRLQKNVEVAGGNILSYCDGQAWHSDVFEYAYAEFAAGRTKDFPVNDELDRLISNKIFKVSALVRAGIVFGDDPAAALAEVNARCTHGRFRGIQFASAMDTEAIWDQVTQPGLAERLDKYAVKAITGGEKITDMKPFLKSSLLHLVSRKALFVGKGGALHGATKEIYDRFAGPKAIAPASLDQMPPDQRNGYYSRYRIIFMEGMDSQLRPRVLHKEQVCYPMLNHLVGTADIAQTTAFLEARAKEDRHKRIRNKAYALHKTSVYLAENKKVRRTLYRGLNRLYGVVLPLKKRGVLFVSDGRESLGGNMKEVYDHLPEGMRASFDFTGNKWTAKSLRELLGQIYKMSTHKYIILEDFYAPMEYMRVRRGQEICQLWHAAGAYKKFAFSRADGMEAINIHNGYKKYAKAIVSAPAIRRDYADAFQISLDKVQATGIPRTDMFFDPAHIEQAKAAIYEAYPAFKDKKVVLFAPTYRGQTLHTADYDFDQLDPEKLYKELKDEYVFVFKWHPATYETLREANVGAFEDEKYKGFFYDLSAERDINDLLLVTDILVTDYSSVIFDYLLVDKPIIYYAYDFEEYSSGRGLYYVLEEYLYGPVVRDIDALIEAIRTADPCPELREAFRQKFMSACDGHATERTIDFIFRNKLPEGLQEAPGIVMKRSKGGMRADKKPVHVFAVRDRKEQLSIEGVLYSEPDNDVTLSLEDENGSRYEAVCQPYPKENVTDTAGQVFLRAQTFRIDLPMQNAAYFFMQGTAAGAQKTEAVFEGSFGLGTKAAAAGTFLDGCTVSRAGQKILVKTGGSAGRAIPDKKEILRAAKHLRVRTALKKSRERKRLLAISSGTLNEKTALITIRGEQLEDNLALLQKELNGPVTTFAHRRPFDDRTTTELYKKLFESKVVVTDDYMWLYRTYAKPKGQKLVQVWHACGAFKKFGVDGTSMFPGVDALTHQYYDLVTVSSEAVRQIYAQAFDIEIEKVQALGSPRTDILFDEKKKGDMKAKVLAAHPELAGKQVILYAPTFRDLPGVPRSQFHPALDFDHLSASLREDQIFVICPHPVMTEKVLPGNYENVKEIRDCTTMEVMMAADLLVTDYSSVIFEYSLLGKPIAFYCYDFNEYDRDFYLDYETDLPGELFVEQTAFEEYLAAGTFQPDERQERFVEKYMSACDGHSTDRIARAIEALAGKGDD